MYAHVNKWIKKITNTKKAEGMIQVVERPHSKYDVMRWNPSAAKKIKNKQLCAMGYGDAHTPAVLNSWVVKGHIT
jgi:hypothetical protein